MPQKSGPNVRQRRVARRLQNWRLAHGGTQEEIGKKLGWSDAKLSRYERADQNAGPAEIIAIATILGISETERDHMVNVAVAAAEQDGWWRAYGPEVVRGNFEDFIETEADASTVCNVETTVIPGLLQTSDYADAIMRAWLTEPDEQLTGSRRELRQQRQQRLDEDAPLALHTIIHENALHMSVGNDKVVAGQLDHLLERAEQTNVTLQVVATATGAHPGMGIAYNVIYFSDSETPAVYLDNLTDGIYLEDDADVAAYTVNFEQLSRTAANPDDSARLIQHVRERWMQ